MLRVLVGLAILGAIYMGHGKYMERKYKDKFRSEIKSISIPKAKKQELEQNVPFSVDLNNNYPEIVQTTSFDVNFDMPEDRVLMAKMHAHRQRCDFLKNPKLKIDENYRKAALAVISEDNIVITQILKQGDKERFKVSQPLKECTEYDKLKNPSQWKSD